MAASENSLLQLRFRAALDAYPMRRRISETFKILNECTVKELQILYQVLVENVFGLTGLGWNLRGTNRIENRDDFNALLTFFYPYGAFFDIIHKLLADVYLKYEYNVAYIPANLSCALNQGNVSRFFLDKLNVDPVTQAPLSFHLNAYEFYMFHFGFHLLSPFHVRRQAGCKFNYDTVYLYLTDRYVAHFFPIESSVVLPVVHCNQMTPRTPLPQSPPVSKFIKPSAFKNILANATATVSQSHAENWRSDMLMQIIIYFWLHVPPEQRPMDSFSPNCAPYSRQGLDNSFGRGWTDTRATGEHLRTVRNMIKHIHYFSNNVRNDGSTMDEIRRSIRSVLQQPLFQFLKYNIHHWPLDSSFLPLLETYLSYIQPWRYQSYNPETQTGQSTSVDPAWAPFVLDNIETYSAIIPELISRFARMDLESPRHAHMMYRLTKVLAEPDLPALLYNADLTIQKRGDIDSHISMFSSSMELHLMGLLKNIKSTIMAVCNQEKAANEQPPSSFTQILRDLIFGVSNEDYSSTDRQTTLAYLENSLHGITAIFGVQAPEPDSLNTTQCSVQPALLDPHAARKRAAFFKYSGNPDLQPIRSTESATLVRLLHKVSVSVNQVHGQQLVDFWYRSDFYGRVCRQFLAPPCLAYHFHKTAPGNPAPRIATSLPPRVCLRPLASHRTLFTIFLLLFTPYLLNYSSPLFHLTVFIIYVGYIMAWAAVEPYLPKTKQQSEAEDFIPPDISFNE